MRHDLPTLEKQPVTESPTIDSFVPDAFSMLVVFKGIGCSRRARLWNRQASIILDLVLSVCVFAACSGKAFAQSHGASSTASADYATKLGEDPLLKLRDITSGRYNAKAMAGVTGVLYRHIKFWANYHQLGHPRKTFRNVNRYIRRRLQSHPRWRSPAPPYVPGPSLIGRNAAF